MKARVKNSLLFHLDGLLAAAARDEDGKVLRGVLRITTWLNARQTGPFAEPS
jgi:hypothetical protein